MLAAPSAAGSATCRRCLATVGGEDARLPLSAFATSGMPHRLTATRPTDGVDFELTPTFHQGRPRWIVVHFDWLAHVEGRAQWELTADINGYTAASIDLISDGRSVVANSLSLLGGSIHQASPRHTLRVAFANYAQVQSFIAGANNRLTFQLRKESGSPKASAEVRVLDTSGLEVTSISPSEVSIGLPHELYAKPGETLRVPFEIRRRGERPDGPAELLLGAVPAGLTPDGPTRMRFVALGDRRTGSFSLRAVREGDYVLAVRVDSSYNRAGGLVKVHVGVMGRRVRWKVVGPALAIAVAFGVGVIIRRSRLAGQR